MTHFTTFNHVIKGDRCQSCFGELIILLTDCVCYVFLIMYIIYFDVIFEEWNLISKLQKTVKPHLNHFKYFLVESILSFLV